MTQLHELSALELAAHVRARQVSPTEVVEHTLERVERIGPVVGAFTHVATEHAREQAKVAEALLTSGDSLPVLLGVPCPVKDLNQVAGLPCEAGSATLAGSVATVDDGVVTRLAEAGTVMVGKTTTPEFGLAGYTEPDTAPPARTPWDLSRSAGGSSGGAAAAVAARIVPVAHASDGGGSIRIPASACGLVGLKPSRGRVSPGPGGVDGPALATGGVLTTDVRDTAALLDVLSVGWPGDQYRLPGPESTFLEACGARPDRLRVGVLHDPVVVPDAPVHPAVVAAVNRAARLLEQLGHHVESLTMPALSRSLDAFQPLWTTVALAQPVAPEREHLLTPLTRWLRDQGRSVSGVDFVAAVGAGQRLSRDVAAVWEGYDVILTPTLAQPPAPVGAQRDDADPAGDWTRQSAFTPWASLWNVTGAPAISLPLHREDVDGVELPIGVMLAGRLGAEETLLALAAELEEADPWRGTLPQEPE